MFKKSIIRLMDERKWEKVRDRLDEILDQNKAEVSNPIPSRSLRTLERQLSRIDIVGQNALHRCIWNQPPLDVLESIIKYDPDSVLTEDYLDQTALHLAVTSYCTLDVVERIIELNPSAALKFDQYQRCPIHCAVSNQSSVNIVATLCLAAPSMIRLIDSRGLTLIDLAIKHKAPEPVICFLNRFLKLYKETLERTEAYFERSVEDGKIELPRGGITDEVLARMVDDSFNWKKGKAAKLFCLEQPMKQQQKWPQRRRSSTAGAA